MISRPTQVQLFFQNTLKIFLQVQWQRCKYSKGAFNLVLYEDKKIIFVRQIYQIIFKKKNDSPPEPPQGGGRPLQRIFNSIWRGVFQRKYAKISQKCLKKIENVKISKNHFFQYPRYDREGFTRWKHIIWAYSNPYIVDLNPKLKNPPIDLHPP